MSDKHKSLSVTELASLFEAGYSNLFENREYINGLNVFPVPDGDTGINMSATLKGGIDSADTSLPLDLYLSSFSRATLMEARGNSGVILSQFIRGFAAAGAGEQNFTVRLLKKCMTSGTAQAYRSVVNPVEGTMLTVMREASEHIEKLDDAEYLEEAFDEIISEMERSLARTPDLLEVLKEAGVIDSGGAGMLCIFEGMRDALEKGAPKKEYRSIPVSRIMHKAPDTGIDFGYCTEFILQVKNGSSDISDRAALTKELEKFGDSIVLVRDGDLLKVHIHTQKPENVLAFAHPYGEFLTVKIENMTVQNAALVNKTSRIKKKIAVAAVASGEGIKEYFASIGADIIIDGGQTENPSANDMIKAFEKYDSEHIILLPNNSNIIFAAKQAADLYKGASVHVIETRSIAEGYSALSMLDNTIDDVEKKIALMRSCLDGVSTCYVTTATRDAVMNGVDIKKDSYIGLDGERVLSCDNDKVRAALKTLENLPDIDDKQVLTVFYGADVSDAELEEFVSAVEGEYPLFDIGIINGKQRIYSFIMSIE